MADDAKKAEKAQGEITEKPAQGEGTQVKITMDDGAVKASYSNFCRVTGTPEEVIIDFSLNPNPYAQQDQTIKVNNRLVLNLFTAKRLFAALQQTIMRHEQSFGAIELNVRRRMSPDAAAAQEKK